MGQIITHACGHEQIHYLSGFASQQERKARWLKATKCRNCFVATKQGEQAEAAVRNSAAIAHLRAAWKTADRARVWSPEAQSGATNTQVAWPVGSYRGVHHGGCGL